MSSFAETVATSRRTLILRLLVETGGAANESVINSCVRAGGFQAATRDDIRKDLDHLKEVGCTAEEWIEDRIRVVTVTERGEEAAHGRIDVAGVERSRWKR